MRSAEREMRTPPGKLRFQIADAMGIWSPD